jgi:hypothetical protein
MPESLTITQGLREVKTLHDRIAKKRQFVNDHLVRQADRRDPLENDADHPSALARDLQAIGDMELRILTLRRQITIANLQTQVTIGDRTMSIFEWIIWKREIAPFELEHLQAMGQSLNAVMNKLDIRFNFSVLALQEASDRLTRDLGELDGLLWTANATTLIDVPPALA